MPHQVDEFLHHIKLQRSATFSDTGAGKTYPILSATEFRFQTKIISSCLYVAPNSILEKIKEEIQVGTNLTPLILQSYNRKKRIELIKTKADIHIINYEALQYFIEFLLDNKYDQIVFDEAHNLRDYRSNTSKAAKQLGDKARFCVAATGTPFCSAPEDLFGMYKVLSPAIFGNKIGEFRQKFCQRVEKQISRNGKSLTFQQTVGFKQGSEIEFRRLVNSISICNKKENCLNLPDKIEENRRVELNSNLKKAYRQLMLGTLSISDSDFSMDSGGVKCLRASQISSGFLYHKENSQRIAFEIGTSNKLEELKKILEFRQERKTVIWCKFKHTIEMLSKEFVHLNPQIQTSGNNNHESRKIFQTDDNCKLIISQVNICDGYELTASDCAVYFEMPYEYHKLKQSQDRIHRKGSEIHKQIMYFYLITRGTIEETILTILKRKQNLSDVITGDLRGVLSGTYGED
jgi:SNF2 family DNA or RNA helicase